MVCVLGIGIFEGIDFLFSWYGYGVFLNDIFVGREGILEILGRFLVGFMFKVVGCSYYLGNESNFYLITDNYFKA